MGSPRVAIVVRHGLNATAWRVRHARGEVSDATPYAYHLAEPSFELEWSADRAENSLAHWWRMTVRRILGFDFVHVWRNRALIARSDVVWTHTEREHLAVALLRMLAPRRYRARLIAQSVWLWDLWPGVSAPRRALFTRLLKHVDVEVVLSRVNRDAALEAVPGRRVVRLPFGTHFAEPRTAETSTAETDPPTPPRVLVVGNDRHRDWPLVAAVAKRLPEADFDVISLSEDVRAMSWPMNVQVRSVTQREILTDAYADATVVALPLRPNRHASGCTVAIEAVSAGVPVVASDTGGIDEYLADAASTLVPVGDVDGFVRGIEAAIADPPLSDPDVAARRGLSEADYVARLVAVTHALIADDAIPPAVEVFERLPADETAPEGVAR
ncbi:glycosyltransferase [Microbacterium sp. ET2]|uniref:glycosyltransferase n=1 Tax=Microbacterium albipurpureum TaxID=3050384 RepID=UPI00259D0845|nr:glycosyltransferase [Microbacterium sp. ET2 (Ac-2212)]WJL94741.1 glycosyltransferase [Microbacterium sp. ET2 (Ac-2212)]